MHKFTINSEMEEMDEMQSIIIPCTIDDCTMDDCTMDVDKVDLLERENRKLKSENDFLK